MTAEPTTALPSPDAAAPIDSGLHCVQCEYNLTGVAAPRCPECGWVIDWTQAVLCARDGRRGTPASRAHGWARPDAVAHTVLYVLFLPWRFARDLRVDESLGPGLGVAIAAFSIGVIGHISDMDAAEAIAIAVTVAACVVLQSVVFATVSRGARWRQRVRMWLNVSLYTTCFTATWTVVQPPIVFWSGPNFYWLFKSSGGWISAETWTTVIFYWWWCILAVVMVVRNRPRWLAVATTPLVFVVASATPFVYVWTARLFEALVGDTTLL